MNRSLEWVLSANPGGVRRAAGIRQLTMAAALGFDRSALAGWEAARRPVPARHFVRWRRVIEGLARHLEIPEEDG
jgi:hypothetical protein